MQLAGGGGRRGSRRKAYRQMSEINVTPFVDVMLVLLIVFMVTAPLLTVGVPVDLPKTNAPPLAVDKEPLYVSVKPDGTIWIQESQVDLPTLAPKLVAIAGARLDEFAKAQEKLKKLKKQKPDNGTATQTKNTKRITNGPNTADQRKRGAAKGNVKS